MTLVILASITLSAPPAGLPHYEPNQVLDRLVIDAEPAATDPFEVALITRDGLLFRCPQQVTSARRCVLKNVPLGAAELVVSGKKKDTLQKLVVSPGARAHRVLLYRRTYRPVAIGVAAIVVGAALGAYALAGYDSSLEGAVLVTIVGIPALMLIGFGTIFSIIRIAMAGPAYKWQALRSARRPTAKVREPSVPPAGERMPWPRVGVMPTQGGLAFGLAFDLR